ncbi:methionyl-tRNA formyltransferase [Cetobacterium sp. 2A]|uniref:methionyl-tRNA formyltransferase n=1 Tax=Cetobacterium sp. 2A TaxID=2754723 RepID=UPI00163CF8FC|nr:methionyl-tRNA formyltransferase [Cetobacterium sp. 2A]MBC2856180.1 methionyl-tRNA formyltransferase [Cetobacterium sp. 2A]
MKIVFIGTVESSYVSLEEMIKNQIKIEAVFTVKNNNFNSDYKNLIPLCKKNGIRSYEINNINDRENIEELKKINPDMIFVIGFSQLIKEEILRIPKYGSIGFHPTLLPKNRGRAVIPWTILQEEKVTGITLFRIDDGTDTGDIIYQEKIILDKKETSTTLYEKVLVALRSAIKEKIHDIVKMKINPTKQNEEEATYCALRQKEDGLINWNDTANNIDRLIRASTKPYPGAFTYHKGSELIIWESELIEKDNWSAIPGQRVEIVKGKGVKVKTGSGLILIKKINYQGEDYDAWEIFKISGKKFGSVKNI